METVVEEIYPFLSEPTMIYWERAGKVFGMLFELVDDLKMEVQGNHVVYRATKQTDYGAPFGVGYSVEPKEWWEMRSAQLASKILESWE